jgi:hypothetical protein
MGRRSRRRHARQDKKGGGMYGSVEERERVAEKRLRDAGKHEEADKFLKRRGKDKGSRRGQEMRRDVKGGDDNGGGDDDDDDDDDDGFGEDVDWKRPSVR